MSKPFEILLIGNLNDNHLIRFTENLHRENNSISIDVLSTSRPSGDSVVLRQKLGIRKIFYLHKYKNIRIVGYLLRVLDIYLSLLRITLKRHYSIINIHYPSFEFSPSTGLLKKLSDKLVLTPWGSDVYRINRIRINKLKKLYNASDYITGSDGRFVRDFTQLFQIDLNKIVRLNFGSDTIDYLNDNIRFIDSNQAKDSFGIKNCYVITCGYNASEYQNHSAIIDSLCIIKDSLPDNCAFLFPMTYGGNKEYINDIMNKANILGNTHFFLNYMNMPDLARLRMATDLFIHVQKTDAANTSLLEYIFCQKKIIHGGWLKYKFFVDNPVDFIYTIDSIDKLPSAILDAIDKPEPVLSEAVYSAICNRGWRQEMKKWNDFFESIV